MPEAWHHAGLLSQPMHHAVHACGDGLASGSSASRTPANRGEGGGEQMATRGEGERHLEA
jgi:hypothetical protein